MSVIWSVFNLILLLSIIFIVPILIGVYVYRDAKRRGMNALVWTLIALFAPSLIGFIIYLLVRNSYSDLECPRCQTTIKDEYVLCPKCGAKLRPFCPNCSAPVEPDWKVCPRCASPLEEIGPDVVVPTRKKDKSLGVILLLVILGIFLNFLFVFYQTIVPFGIKKGMVLCPERTLLSQMTAFLSVITQLSDTLLPIKVS